MDVSRFYFKNLCVREWGTTNHEGRTSFVRSPLKRRRRPGRRRSDRLAPLAPAGRSYQLLVEPPPPELPPPNDEPPLDELLPDEPPENPLPEPPLERVSFGIKIDLA